MSNLDARIALVEQRLMARDLNLQLGVAEFRERAASALKPAALFDRAGKALGLGGGLALAGTGLMWLWRSRRPSLAMGSGSGGSDAEVSSGGSSLFSLAGLVGLAWPWMPAKLQDTVSPGVARMLIGIGLPLAAKLFATKRAPALPAMTGVDPSRFAGDWYALAHLPLRLSSHCDGVGVVRYTLRRPGQYDLRLRCPQPIDRPAGGGRRSARGVLRAVQGSGGGKFRLSTWPRALRWLPMAWSDHWILHLDRHYEEALVGSPDRSALWVLSRAPGLPSHRLQALLAMAHDDGFDIDDLQFAEGVDPELDD
ncbi:MAG: lipocalin family protein [Rubrivivax sp.]